MNNHRLIGCPNCETKVNAIELGQREYGATDDHDPFTIHFLECPVCHVTMVARSEPEQIAPGLWEESPLLRLWPKPRRILDPAIPTSVRRSIEEAQKCFDAQAYAACAVMCGRSLEALCQHCGAKEWQLARGLKEMKERGIIDGRLLDWGEALRDRRNIGAHATGEDISRDDASDLLDFTIAICEYVYVLTEKYELFQRRETARKAKKPRASPV